MCGPLMTRLSACRFSKTGTGPIRSIPYSVTRSTHSAHYSILQGRSVKCSDQLEIDQQLYYFMVHLCLQRYNGPDHSIYGSIAAVIAC
jgi:hypothetical protein